MTIELTKNECQVLEQLLDAAIRDLGPEIRHTMTSDYKEDLKTHKRVLQGIYERLCAANAD
jgi:hypothetical protein